MSSSCLNRKQEPLVGQAQQGPPDIFTPPTAAYAAQSLTQAPPGSQALLGPPPRCPSSSQAQQRVGMSIPVVAHLRSPGPTPPGSGVAGGRLVAGRTSETGTRTVSRAPGSLCSQHLPGSLSPTSPPSQGRSARGRRGRVRGGHRARCGDAARPRVLTAGAAAQERRGRSM